jgi:hypothetical protein
MGNHSHIPSHFRHHPITISKHLIGNDPNFIKSPTSFLSISTLYFLTFHDLLLRSNNIGILEM